MVRMKKATQETRSVYYLKHGQTLENTRVSERSLALIVPQKTFDRFTSYVNEDYKVALMAEREAKRISALREAARNMTKSWEDTAKNIQKRRKEDLLSRRKKEEDENLRVMRELAAKNAMERAEVVRQAKQLILYRMPQCRLINGALLSAECFRELNEQMKFQETKRELDKKLEEEYAKRVMDDVEKFRQEEKEKEEANTKKLQKIKKEMEKQIARNKAHMAKIEASTRKSETEDLHNMHKEIEEIKRKELEDELNKKKELKKMFLEAIEEKKEYELQLQKEQEFQDNSTKIYQEFKESMDKEMKMRTKKAREEKARKIEILAKKIGAQVEQKQRTSLNRERKRKDSEEKDLEEEKGREITEKLEEERRKKEQARAELQAHIKLVEEEQEKRRREEEELKVWETLQKYKRDEFNKEWIAKQQLNERNKRLGYGELLLKQMADRDAQRRKEKIFEDDSVEVKQMINKANEKVLAYGERVLQESRGVRPTYPIEKTIQQFKRDVGLIPAFNREYEEPMKMPKRRVRRPACVKPPDELNSFFFA